MKANPSDRTKLSMNLSKSRQILMQTFKEFMDDKAMRLSAALAYYSVFSLAPLLLIAIAVAGMAFGEEAVRGQLDNQLKSSLGASGAFAVQEMVANAQKPQTNVLVAIAGIVMLLLGAGGLFGQLQDALNTVWGVEAKTGLGWKRMLKNRFLSFTMVLGTGFLLLTSMILTTVIQSVSRYGEDTFQLPPLVWGAVSGVFSFILVTLLFASIFKLLPDALVHWRHVWVGAIFTAALFVAGKFVMGWYLGREATASSYGTAGSLALVLLWVYYSSIILLFGAEFTQVWANSRGSDIDIEPTSNALKTGSRASPVTS